MISKKLSAISLMACAFVMCLALAGCGNAGSASSSSSDTASSSSSASAASESSSSASEGSASESSSSASEASASESSSSAAEFVSNLTDEEKEAYQGSFTGNWKMVALSDGETVMRVEDADEEAQKNAEVTATFKDDGSTKWSVMGDKRTGTWEPTGKNTIIIHFDAIEGFDEIPAYTGTLEDGTLAIDEQGIVMLLEKAK